MKQTDSFADKARKWESAPKLEMTGQFVRKIREIAKFENEDVLMDVGCGTGLVGLSFREEVGQLLMVDTSAAMLEVLREKISPETGVVAGGTRAQVQIFHHGIEELPEGTDANYIVSLQTMHHMDDVQLFFKEAYARLKPSGKILLGDVCLEDGSFHAPDKVPHNGFDPLKLCEELRQIGFVDVSYAHLMSIQKRDHWYDLFFVSGSR